MINPPQFTRRTDAQKKENSIMRGGENLHTFRERGKSRKKKGTHGGVKRQKDAAV